MSRARVLSAAAAVLAIGLPLSAIAQTADAERQTEAVRRGIVSVLALPTLMDLTGSRTVTGPDAKASIVAGSGGGRGEFTLGLESPDKAWIFGARLSAPLSGDTTRFVLGDQLPAGNKLAIEGTRVLYSKIQWDSGIAARVARAAPSLVPPGAERSDSAQVRTIVQALADERAITKASLVLLTGSYEYSRATFKFRSAADHSPLDEFHEPVSYAVQGGYLWLGAGGKTGTYVGGGYRESHAWKAPDGKVLCPATDQASADRVCDPVVIGPPAETVRESLSLEVRQRGSRFGWMPQVTYDLADAAAGRRWGIEVPFYLVAKSKDAPADLTGGVVLGARQGGDRYVAVFIGPSFSLPWSPPKAADVMAGLQQAR